MSVLLDEVTYHTTATIKPSGIAVYTLPSSYIISSEKSVINRKNLSKRNKSLGTSDKSRKKLKNYLEWFARCTPYKYEINQKTGKRYKYKLSFITLTLSAPQIHSDNEIKSKLLNQFLIEIKEKYNIYNVIWKAELQQNGNIHFHITIDKYLHWEIIRNLWNRIQNKLGYVDRFKDKNGHDNPNSTDVHSVNNIKDWAGYLSSYMSKDNLIEDMPMTELMHQRYSDYNNRLMELKGYVVAPVNVGYISGNNWYASKSIQSLKNVTFQTNISHEDELTKLVDENDVKLLDSEYCKYVCVDANDLAKLGCHKLNTSYQQGLRENRGKLRVRWNKQKIEQTESQKQHLKNVPQSSESQGSSTIYRPPKSNKPPANQPELPFGWLGLHR